MSVVEASTVVSTNGVDLAFSDYNYELHSDTLNMNVIIINQGDEDFTAYAPCGLYYSEDSIYDWPEDPKIYHKSIMDLDAHAEESFNFQLRLKRINDYQYVLLVIDEIDSVPEFNEMNNKIIIELPTPTATDLGLDMAYYEKQARAGDSIVVQAAVVNYGRIESNPYEISYSLSEDIFLDNSDELLFKTSMPAIGVGSSITHIQKLLLPSMTEDGSYYILVKLTYPNDLNEKNNLGRLKYYILEAEAEQKVYDLAVSVPFGIINSVAGDTLGITYTIENLLDSIPGSTVISYFLSTDEVINSQDILLDTKGLSALDKGESKVMLDSVIIPLNILPGTYAIIISIGENNSFNETYIANNIALIYCLLKATGISNERISAPGIQLYPNPASALIQLKSGRELNSYKIFNNQGQVVRSSMLDRLNEARIDVEALNPGIYYIQVTSGKQVETVLFEVAK